MTKGGSRSERTRNAELKLRDHWVRQDSIIERTVRGNALSGSTLLI